MPFNRVLLGSHGEWYLEEALQFKMETEMWKEARNMLGSEFVSK